MKSFKGQAALEFMMTYGWAILVVLAAIGALSYFGVLDPSRFTPDTCMGSSGFSCDGKPVAYGDSIVFTISNGVGYNVLLSSESSLLSNVNQCTGTNGDNILFCPRGLPSDPTCAPSTDAVPYELKDGATVTINVSGCVGNSALNIVKGELEFSFNNAKSGLPETVLFTFVAKPK